MTPARAEWLTRLQTSARPLVVWLVSLLIVGAAGFVWGRYGGGQDAAAVAMLDTTNAVVAQDSAAEQVRMAGDAVAIDSINRGGEVARTAFIAAAVARDSLEQLAQLVDRQQLRTDSLRALAKAIARLARQESDSMRKVVGLLAGQRDIAVGRWAIADAAAKTHHQHLVEARDREARYVARGRAPRFTAGPLITAWHEHDVTRLRAGVGAEVQVKRFSVKGDWYPGSGYQVQGRYAVRLPRLL